MRQAMTRGPSLRHPDVVRYTEASAPVHVRLVRVCRRRLQRAQQPKSLRKDSCVLWTSRGVFSRRC